MILVIQKTTDENGVAALQIDIGAYVTVKDVVCQNEIVESKSERVERHGSTSATIDTTVEQS